jgi:hypothetical protein
MQKKRADLAFDAAMLSKAMGKIEALIVVPLANESGTTGAAPGADAKDDAATGESPPD